MEVAGLPMAATFRDGTYDLTEIESGLGVNRGSDFAEMLQTARDRIAERGIEEIRKNITQHLARCPAKPATEPLAEVTPD